MLRNGLKMVEALKDNLAVRTWFVAPQPAQMRTFGCGGAPGSSLRAFPEEGERAPKEL